MLVSQENRYQYLFYPWDTAQHELVPPGHTVNRNF